MKIIVKSSYASLQYFCDAINNCQIAHLLLSISVEYNGQTLAVFRVNTYDEENRVHSLPA